MVDQYGLGEVLSKLPKVDKSNLLASFVKQQQRNSNVYQVEGRKYLQSWGKERKVASSTVGSRLSKASGGEVRKLEERRGEGSKGRAGIETPVLKPRNPDLKEKASSMMYGKEHSTAVNGKKRRVPEEVKGDDKEKAKATPRKAVERAKDSNVAEDKGSDSGDDTDTRDRNERMNARKERRREKREIVNLKKRKASPKRSADGDSDDDEATGKGKKVSRNKKQKVPAGLALMHGFSATNVGKSRLTMEHTSKPTGVFSKGKASTTTTTTRKATAKTGFSELQFLNQRSSRGKENSPEGRAPKRRDKDKPPSKKKKPAKEPTPEPSSSKESSSSSSESEEEEAEELESEVQERPKRRPRSSSVTWDIERESVVLASTDLSIEIPLAQTTKAMRSEPAKEQEALQAGGEHSERHDADKPRSSLGPGDSASQCIARDSSPPKRRPEVNTFSKYFKQILDQESPEESSGKAAAQSIPCPTFIADAPKVPTPSPPSVENRAQTTVSSHQQDARTLAWEAPHPAPPWANKMSKYQLASGGSKGWELTNNEPWPDDSIPIGEALEGSFGVGERYDTDNVQIGAQDFVEVASFMDGDDDFEEYDTQGYWEGTERLLEDLPEEYDFDMDTNFVDEDYDCVGTTFDDEPETPWSVYDNDFMEESYDAGVPAGYGCLGWDQMPLDDSQDEAVWQPIPEPVAEAEPDPSDDDHESLVEMSELGAYDSGENNATLQGLLRDSVDASHFLQGRSALLGFDVDMGLRPVDNREERGGATKVEIDVAKSLKNHWRPQRM